MAGSLPPALVAKALGLEQRRVFEPVRATDNDAVEMAPEAAVAVFKPGLAAILAALSQVKFGIPHPDDNPFFGLMTASEDAPDAGREARPFVLWRPEVLILQPARAGLADGRAAEVIPAAFIVGVAVYGAVNQRNEALAEDAFGVKIQHSRTP